MLELKIPNSILEEPMQFSASVVELGQSAGAQTWSNAKEHQEELTLTPEQLQEARDYLDGFEDYLVFRIN